MSDKKIYFVAGEASGDNHGAALMRSLRNADPSLRLIGRGGPKMHEFSAGPFHNWIDQAGVVGLWEVLKKYSFFRAEFDATLAEIEREQPDCIVLIDYPGFNLRLSKALRRQRKSPPIIYYISPQVWAWNRGRIKQMAKWLDLMLCIFPFEADLYNQSGLRTIFVGHPIHEGLEAARSDAERDRSLVALFPGSREREVRKILPVMLKAAALLRQRDPQLRFEIAAASKSLEGAIRSILKTKHPNESRFVHVTCGRATAAMQEAWAGMVASGSATLEAAWFKLPFVLVYKVSWLTYFVGRLVIKVHFLGMPNVIAGRAIVPEFIQHEAMPAPLATAVARLVESDEARRQMLADFDEVVGKLGHGGASDRAAAAIRGELNNLQRAVA